MKTLKHILVIALLTIFTVLITTYIDDNNRFLPIFVVLIIGVFMFNLMFRKSLSFKNYFISKYNLFTTKTKFEIKYNIPKELMFEKVIEVINESNFKIVDTDTNKLDILATSSVSFMSWGENLYLSFETKGMETVMSVCVSTVFGMYSWGKNEQNYKDLLKEIENSLII